MSHIFYNIIVWLKHPLVLIVLAIVLAAINMAKTPKTIELKKRYFVYSVFIVLGVNILVATVYLYLTWFIGMAAFSADSMARVAGSMMGITGTVIQFVLFLIIAWLVLRSYAKSWIHLSER